MTTSVDFSDFRKISRRFPACYDHRLVLRGGRIVAERLERDILGRTRRPNAKECEENRRVMKVFQNVVLSAPHADKMRRNEILHHCRYYGLDFDSRIEAGLPLLPVDIEKVGVASAILFTSDIQRNEERLQDLTPQQIKERVDLADTFHFLGKADPESWYFGAHTTLMEYIVKDHFSQDLRLTRVFHEVTPHLFSHQHAFAEHVSKGILCNEPFVGTIIPAPDFSQDEDVLDYFQVQRQIASKSKGGLFAVTLTPISSQSNLDPMLAFRPTQIRLNYSGTLASLQEDAFPDVGRRGYLAAKKELVAAIKEARAASGDKYIVGSGYSKGGSELQHCYMDHWQHFKEVVFFNDPSIDKKPVERFAKMINRLPRQPIQRSIVIYRTKNDITHFGGEKHVGWGIRHPDFRVQVVEFDHPSYKEHIPMYRIFKLMDRHGHRHLLNTELAKKTKVRIYEGKEADRQLDNSKRGEVVLSYERFRRKWGKCIFMVAHFFYRLFARIFSCLGFPIDKESLEVHR